MNQYKTGKFISRKRKEQNLTQEQLANKLNISNKTISKWETGKCMPDYSVVEALCDVLKITVSELVEGEELETDVTKQNDDQIIELLRRTQQLEKQNVRFNRSLESILLILTLISAMLTIGYLNNILHIIFLVLAVVQVIIKIYSCIKHKNEHNKININS